MELKVFPAGRILHTHSDGHARGLEGCGAENRELLEDDAQIGIVLQQGQRVTQSTLAVAASLLQLASQALDGNCSQLQFRDRSPANP